MDDTSVLHPVGETRLAGVPPFDIIKGKPQRPLVWPETIRRSGLIEERDAHADGVRTINSLRRRSSKITIYLWGANG